jgi:cation diffusion facilitator CzcD-associated flavoprotein CzcO
MNANQSELDADTLVVGAGPAGLAVAACLRRAGVTFVILERTDRIGSAWHSHYERLHLHTDKGHSALPFVPFAPEYPRYPSRTDVIRYLDAYARQFDLRPRFGEEVTRAWYEVGCWRIETREKVYCSRHLVLATGSNRQPIIPTWPGQEEYAGSIAHSSAYRDGSPYRGQRVLVVGFGNSGGEIALDLSENGARPSLAVRGPVNVVPREILGVPILTLAILLGRVPAPVADRLNALVLKVAVGNYQKFGLRQAEVGPLTQIARRGRIPLIDVGTMRLIRTGQIAVYPGIERFTTSGARFVDGREAAFDAVILATGYRPALANILADADRVSDKHGVPLAHGGRTALPGLYFCGFHVVATGMLREIAREAQAIARDISQ